MTGYYASVPTEARIRLVFMRLSGAEADKPVSRVRFVRGADQAGSVLSAEFPSNHSCGFWSHVSLLEIISFHFFENA